jgi:hypothetical protein
MVSDFPGLAMLGTVVKVADRRAALRAGDATFDAYPMTCTHQQATVNIISNHFICRVTARATHRMVRYSTDPQQSMVKLNTRFDPIANTLTISNP